jgi:hypothetical protein
VADGTSGSRDRLILMSLAEHYDNFAIDAILYMPPDIPGLAK